MNVLARLDAIEFPALRRDRLETVQVNVGYRCNQACAHCHVDAGPKRREEMQADTAEQVLAFVGASGATTLDITGGAPELNANFRRLVTGGRAAGARVIDRCNLTILLEPGQEDLAEFLAVQDVEIVASLPCYSLENVDKQRGKGVFDKSIKALRLLNARGFGKPDSGLVLNLVYNPVGPHLPPLQAGLEADYKRELADAFGISFNRLFTLCNMPINRFAHDLVSSGRFDAYMQTLQAAHNVDNLDSVMCRSLISIDWRGFVFDCDFNQMLGLPTNHGGCRRVHVSELMDTDLRRNPIRVMGHCYACTAGNGSSCGGALR